MQGVGALIGISRTRWFFFRLLVHKAEYNACMSAMNQAFGLNKAYTQSCWLRKRSKLASLIYQAFRESFSHHTYCPGQESSVPRHLLGCLPSLPYPFCVFNSQAHLWELPAELLKNPDHQALPPDTTDIIHLEQGPDIGIFYLFYLFAFFKFINLFWETESVWTGEDRERASERIPSMIHTVSAEPDTGLVVTNHEVMTWAKIESDA